MIKIDDIREMEVHGSVIGERIEGVLDISPQLTLIFKNINRQKISISIQGDACLVLLEAIKAALAETIQEMERMLKEENGTIQ